METVSSTAEAELTLAANLVAVRHLAKMLIADRMAALPHNEAAVFARSLNISGQSSEAGMLETRHIILDIVQEAAEIAANIREARSDQRKLQT